MESDLRLGIPGDRNCVNAAANKEQLKRQMKGKLGLLEARRRLAEQQPEPQQNNVPALKEDWVQGKLIQHFMSKCPLFTVYLLQGVIPLVKLWMCM